MSADILPLAPRATVRKEIGNERFQPDTGGRVLQVVQNADMRNGRDGLAELAKSVGVDVTKLLPGQYVVFVNSSRNIVKVYAMNHAANANGTLSHYPVVASLWLPAGQKFDLRVIAHIPKAFNGSGKLDYDKALKETVEEALARRHPGRIGNA